MGLISNAKEIETGVKAAGKKTKERPAIKMPGVKLISHLDAVIKACEAAKEIAVNGMDEALWAQFMKNRGGENGGPGVKPESYNAIEDVAVVNVQCRKRGDNSPLKPEELKVIMEVAATIEDPELKEKFAAKEVVLTPELIAINPVHAENTALMERVEKALEGVKGIPADFIVKQSRKMKYVVSPDLEAAAWKHGDAEVIKIVNILGLRPSLAIVDPKAIGQTITDLFDIDGGPEESVEQVVAAISNSKTKAMKQVPALEGGSGTKPAKKPVKKK